MSNAVDSITHGSSEAAASSTGAQQKLSDMHQKAAADAAALVAQQKAQESENASNEVEANQKRARGVAANILTGGTGLTGTPMTARSYLLGS